MKIKWLIGLVLTILLLVPFGANLVLSKILEVPKTEEVEVVWTKQNWSKDQWEWWYHISQGSGLEAIIPYKWFISLEQPKLSFFQSAGDFIDPKYLEGFGFLSDGKNAYNPDALPVGFAKSENYFDPQSLDKKPKTVIGFTCAACHTGQINYQGKAIRTEGGPAMIELDKFKTAVGLSLLLTKIDPIRFNRFADRVLGKDHTPEESKQLKQELNDLIAQAKETRKQVSASPDVKEGFGRLDALTRIGNFVFGSEVNPKTFYPPMRRLAILIFGLLPGLTGYNIMAQ